MDNRVISIRLVAVVLALTLAPAAAMAYIDPGNGAYMVQAVFALVGAALFYLRHPIRSAKAMWHYVFHRKDHRPEEMYSSDPATRERLDVDSSPAETESVRKNN